MGRSSSGDIEGATRGAIEVLGAQLNGVNIELTRVVGGVLIEYPCSLRCV